MNRLILLPSLFVLTITLGCASGPVRYKTMGNWKYATVELTKRSPSIVKPLAAPAGLVADCACLALDTVSTPIVSIYSTFKATDNFIGEDVDGLAHAVLFIMFYPMGTACIGYGGGNQFLLGEEALWLDNEPNKTNGR